MITSTDLEALSALISAAPSYTSALDKALLTTLREPILTYDGRTMPTTAAQYTKTLATAEKLKPIKSPIPGVWLKSYQELADQIRPKFAVAGMCVNDHGNVSGAFSVGCVGATLELAYCAAICLAWARVLRHNGR